MELEAIQKKESYKVQLEDFEGPLDLLLYLIKREEIDIYDIPIARITRQYLETMELMQELDLDVAGEFILMAATLIQIKVRMLLPREEEESEDIEEDPRAALVRQLIEYKRFKEVADSMIDMEDRQRRLYPRKSFNWTKKYIETEEVSNEELLKNISMFDLLVAFKTVLDKVPKITTHEVRSIKVTVDEQIIFLKKQLEENERITFSDLMNRIKERIVIIVTFIAILELIKTRQITVRQAGVFGELWISAR